MAHIEEAVDWFVARGATLRSPVQDVGGDIKVATVSDPAGNVIGLLTLGLSGAGIGAWGLSSAVLPEVHPLDGLGVVHALPEPARAARPSRR